MSHLFNCVLDINNNHISLNDAQKKIEYKCLECKSDVRVRQGKLKGSIFITYLNQIVIITLLKVSNIENVSQL